MTGKYTEEEIAEAANWVIQHRWELSFAHQCFIHENEMEYGEALMDVYIYYKGTAIRIDNPRKDLSDNGISI